MKKLLIISGIGLIALMVPVLLYWQLNQAMEIDDLRSHIQLQRKEFDFLLVIMNDALRHECSLSVDKFQQEVKKLRGRAVGWDNGIALVGPFRVMKKQSCLARIELVAF